MPPLKPIIPFVLAAIPTVAVIFWAQASVARPADYADQIYKACREIGGQNVGYFIDKNGKPVCTNKRGQRLSRQPNIGAFDAFWTF